MLTPICNIFVDDAFKSVNLKNQDNDLLYMAGVQILENEHTMLFPGLVPPKVRIPS